AELRARREELSGRIREEEAERGRLQGRIWALTERLAGTSESLARHLLIRETVYVKVSYFYFFLSQILESSQILLDVLKGEIGNAGKASEPQSTSKEKQARGQKHS
ncbi:SSNA1 protein, partial [Grus americana]|nr:SSNA1 protein [Grus americana]